MCDTATKQLIEDVVDLWVGQGRAFTAYEVSKEVQARLLENKMPFVRHQDMRDYYGVCKVLTDQVQCGHYTSTQVAVGQNLQAFLFHPVSYDPSQYKPMDRKNNQGVLPPMVTPNHFSNRQSTPVLSSAPSTLPFNTISAVASSSPSTKQKVSVNKSGELWIGQPFLASIGLRAGDSIYLYHDGHNVILTGTLNVNSITPRLVEQKGNARLSPSARACLGLNGTTFEIEEDQGRLVISEC